MSKAVLAIDVGTSSTRAALVDDQLNVLSVGQITNRLMTPEPGAAEQDPDQLWQSLVGAVCECLAGAPQGVRPQALIMDTAMHGLVMIDRSGRPITPLITWADTRSAPYAQTIANTKPFGERLYRQTGCPVHASYLPAKIAWQREEHPSTFKKTGKFVSIKSHLLFRLSQPDPDNVDDPEHAIALDEMVEDLASASASGLLNMHRRDWDPDALTAAGISDHSYLPRLVEPRAIVGHLSKTLADKWRIDPVPLVAGGTDGPFANVGAGCTSPGEMVITIGTSAAVRMIVDQPVVDPLQRTWCYYLGDDAWVVGGALSSGGTSLAWLIDAFPGTFGSTSKSEIYRAIDDMVAQTPPGAEGLMIGPYFSGERSPGWQADARGYVLGIGLHHQVRHFARAIMEGVAYLIAWLVESVQETAGHPDTIRVTGGFLSSQIWSQIVADVLGKELLVPVEKEGSLIGAATFGLSAIDETLDWRRLSKQIEIQRKITPNPATHSYYEEQFAVYKKLYGTIRPHFSTLVAR